MQAEDRSFERTYVAVNCQDERCSLETNGAAVELNEIYNVSLGGAGIDVPCKLDSGTPVNLTFRRNGVRVSTKGTVVWSNEHVPQDRVHATQHFKTGIMFDPSQADSNAKIYVALKDYVHASELPG